MPGTTAEEALAARLIECAAERGIRIATAESLTGGLLAAEIVSVPGASRVFVGGIVAYDTDVKRTLLRVDAGRLAEVGPVDELVAREMARGVRDACAVPRTESGAREPADLGIATTGVAGPDPDPQSGQPAGTVWVAVSDVGGDSAVRLRLTGSRDEIRLATVRAALGLALKRIARVGDEP